MPPLEDRFKTKFNRRRRRFTSGSSCFSCSSSSCAGRHPIRKRLRRHCCHGSPPIPMNTFCCHSSWTCSCCCCFGRVGFPSPWRMAACVDHRRTIPFPRSSPGCVWRICPAAGLARERCDVAVGKDDPSRRTVGAVDGSVSDCTRSVLASDVERAGDSTIWNDDAAEAGSGNASGDGTAEGFLSGSDVAAEGDCGNGIDAAVGVDCAILSDVATGAGFVILNGDL